MTPYNYVFNNPLRFIDPFGLDSIAPNSPGGANNPIPLPGATIVHIQGQNENSGSNSSGWSLLLSGSNGSNNPNGSKLRRGDLWLEIGDILEALGNLIPGRLSKKPAKEKMAGKTIKKSSTEPTTDQKIIEETAGNNNDIIQGEIEKRSGIIEESGYQGEEVDSTVRTYGLKFGGDGMEVEILRDKKVSKYTNKGRWISDEYGPSKK